MLLGDAEKRMLRRRRAPGRQASAPLNARALGVSPWSRFRALIQASWAHKLIVIAHRAPIDFGASGRRQDLGLRIRARLRGVGVGARTTGHPLRREQTGPAQLIVAIKPSRPTARSGQGSGPRAALETCGIGYVLAVACATRARINGRRTPVRADVLADRLPDATRHRQSAGRARGARAPTTEPGSGPARRSPPPAHPPQPGRRRTRLLPVLVTRRGALRQPDQEPDAESAPG